MRLVKVEGNEFAGEYKVYELAVDSIHDVPVVNGDWRTLKVGDFIDSCERLIAPVLDVKIKSNESEIHRGLVFHYVTVITPYGIDYLGKYDSKGRYYWNRLELLRARQHFFSIKRHYTETHLTIREKYFLMMGFQFGFDKAATMVYGKALTEVQLNTKLRVLLGRKDAKEYIMNELKEELKKRNMDNLGWYLDKIDQTLEEGINTPTHLVLFKNLANVANIPEVNNLVNPELGNQLPSGAKIPLEEGKRIEEGTFTEVSDNQSKEELKV